MRIHHCWWTMPMTDTMNKAEIWCWCSDLMNDVNDLVNDTTNVAATWCRFTIADERWHWKMRWIKLRFDADALIWWIMSMDGVGDHFESESWWSFWYCGWRWYILKKLQGAPKPKEIEPETAEVSHSLRVVESQLGDRAAFEGEWRAGTGV